MNVLFQNLTLPFKSVFLKNGKSALYSIAVQNIYLALTKEQSETIRACHDRLKVLGIKYELRGSNIRLIRYPVRNSHSIKDEFLGLLDIFDRPRPCFEVEHVIVEDIQRFVCQNSFKFNDPITKHDASLILSDMGLCDYPWFCIHGRNSVFPLLKDEADEQIQRILYSHKV